VSAHGGISSRRCCAWAPLGVSCAWSTTRSAGPTPAADIAAACLKIAAHLAERPGDAGIYHFAGAPDTSWAGFAEAIFEMAELDVAVEHIPTTEYPLPGTASAELAARLFHDRGRLRHPAPRLAQGAGRHPQDLSRQGGTS
jgi:dTDP-4-dehydrorhamnose reductase